MATSTVAEQDGATVRGARLARGMTQDELARRAGLSRQALGAIESGAYQPGVGVALALARELGHSVEALFGIALTQLVRKGTPVVYGAFTSNVDMRSGAPAFGTPENTRATLAAGQLARLYNLPAPAEEFAKVEYPAESGRSGVLGHGSFLVLTSKPAETSPTARGLFIRNHFLGQEIGRL